MRYRDTRGDDDLVGTSANDIFRIRYGIDTVHGGGGHDRLIVDYGGQTAIGFEYDRIVSESGVLSGELRGGDRSAIVFDDVDRLTFGGSDASDLLSVVISGTADGGAIDVDARGGEDIVVLSFVGAEGRELAVGEDGAVIIGAGRFAGFEHISAYFGDGNDIATGGGRADYFYGREGDDTLSGNGGDDFLYAGPGADTLTGGSGGDTFYYFHAHDSGLAHPDRITDFSRAEGDLIDLSRIDADHAIGRNQYFTFIDQAAFTGSGGANGEVRQQINGDGTITVQGDVNHDGIADFAIVVVTDQPLTAIDLAL